MDQQYPPLLLPSLTVIWGPYAQPDPTEEQAVVTTVRTAMGGGAGGGEPLITKRIALEKLREVFEFESVDAVLDDLEKETQERADKAVKQAAAMAAVQPTPAPLVAPAKPSAPPPKKP
jgi:hypothetical protein